MKLLKRNIKIDKSDFDKKNRVELLLFEAKRSMALKLIDFIKEIDISSTQEDKLKVTTFELSLLVIERRENLDRILSVLKDLHNNVDGVVQKRMIEEVIDGLNFV